MKSRQVTPQAPGPLWPASIPAGDGLPEAFLQRTQKSESLQGEMEIWGCILWLGQVSSLGFPPESPTPSKIIQQSPNNDPFETRLVELQSFSNLLSCPTIVLLQNPNTLRLYQCFSQLAKLPFSARIQFWGYYIYIYFNNRLLLSLTYPSHPFPITARMIPGQPAQPSLWKPSLRSW